MWFLILACKPPSPTPPSGSCPEEDIVTIDLNQGEGWGLTDGTPVLFGIPPQGGAPYAPFEIRMRGAASSDAYTVDFSAVDLSNDEEIGTESYSQRFVCANVGDNKDTRYQSELHMRFYGFEPPEIDGHEVEITVTVTTQEGESARSSFTGDLDWVLGPM